MIAMNNRRNHNFQIEHFIAGSCHTPDAAYSILCDLREDRRDALAQVEASKLRTKAKILRAEKLIREGDEIDKLEAEAELAEIRGFEETVEKKHRGGQGRASLHRRVHRQSTAFPKVCSPP